MSAPVQKPGKSRQDYGSPDDLLTAFQNRFGRIAFDLAAHEENCVVPGYFSEADDSLSKEWHFIGGLLWLNPPFANIDPWAEKCKRESKLGATIAFLTPASVGSDWFREHVHGHAYVLALNPRLTFKGCKDPYPKDCQIAIFGHGLHGFDVWRWK